MTISPSLSTILPQVLSLSQSDQREIVLAIESSLQNNGINPEWERAIIAEADRRMSRVKRGVNVMIEGDDFLREFNGRSSC